MDWMVENIYKKHISHEKELNKAETLNFFNDFLLENFDGDNAGDFTLDGLMPGKVFDSIFALLDESKNGRLDKEEIVGYFIKLIESDAVRPASGGAKRGGETEMQGMK
jgi:hypothetical protein